MEGGRAHGCGKRRPWTDGDQIEDFLGLGNLDLEFAKFLPEFEGSCVRGEEGCLDGRSVEESELQFLEARILFEHRRSFPGEGLAGVPGRGFEAAEGRHPLSVRTQSQAHFEWTSRG
jgi:hypothetical protein